MHTTESYLRGGQGHPLVDHRPVGHRHPGQRHHLPLAARAGLRGRASASCSSTSGCPSRWCSSRRSSSPSTTGSRVYTAYEYLEQRFDRKTRQFTALLFLVSRGLASGLSIYAPALVLSAVLGWPVLWTNLLLGGTTIVYTVARREPRGEPDPVRADGGDLRRPGGGARHRGGELPAPRCPSARAWRWPGRWASSRASTLSLRFDTRYTLWSGLLGGLFVQLAYFGTDQSQVQRYLSGGPLAESRLGLLMNGLLKVPMQLFILFIGVMVFVFYQLTPPPALLQPGGAGAGPSASGRRGGAGWSRRRPRSSPRSGPPSIGCIAARRRARRQWRRRAQRCAPTRRESARSGRRPGRWSRGPSPAPTRRTPTSSSSASCSITSPAGSSACWSR